jgi:radical SAM protein with 4Fe4S-binding SPASM domain
MWKWNRSSKPDQQPDVEESPEGLQMYHYMRQGDEWKTRLHLRFEPDGSGLLVIDASRVLHLNPSAAAMAQLALDRTPPAQAAQILKRKFSVSTRQANADYTQFFSQFESLIHPDGLCPIHNFDLDLIAPFSKHPSAPYRMDLALTYRCNNDCAHCYNARPRNYPELCTDRWKEIIDLLWQRAIPHVVFTGGEPTLREDLPELVAYAQQTGLVTGLNTNGRRLSDRSFLQELISAGLDHVQITLESHDSVIHNRMVRSKNAWDQTVAGIRNALDSPLYVMTNTTMLRENSSTLGQTLDFLAETGVPTVGLNALIYAGSGASCGSGLKETELKPLLSLARSRTEIHNQRLIWYTPTQYCHFDPMELELGVKGCTAALYNMCIEPDGAVIPCQSYYQPLGSFLEDPWEQIWEHDLALSLRQRNFVDEKCGGCNLLAECGGGCPLSERA